MSKQSLMRDLISDLLLLEQIEFKAVFVPQSASRNSADKNPCLNWRVSFFRKTPEHMPVGGNFSLDYMQGIGHVPGHQHSHYYGRMSVDDAARLKAFNASAETGMYPTERNVKALPGPHAVDVLYSIINDRSVTDMRNFEEFADEFGFDVDSRKAEATYRACLGQTRDAERLFGRPLLDKIALILENY